MDVINASGHHSTLRDRVGTWRSSTGIKAVLTVVLALKALLVDGNTPSEAPSLRCLQHRYGNVDGWNSSEQVAVQ